MRDKHDIERQPGRDSTSWRRGRVNRYDRINVGHIEKRQSEGRRKRMSRVDFARGAYSA